MSLRADLSRTDSSKKPVRDGHAPDAGQAQAARYNSTMFKIVIVALLVIFAGLQYRLWVGDGSVAQVHRVSIERDDLADQNAKDETRNNAMQAEVNDLKSGALATEGRARSEMGMVKRDETFFLTLDKKTPGQPAAPDAD